MDAAGWLVGAFVGAIIGITLMFASIVLLLTIRKLAPIIALRDRLVEEDKQILHIEEKEDGDAGKP